MPVLHAELLTEEHGLHGACWRETILAVVADCLETLAAEGGARLVGVWRASIGRTRRVGLVLLVLQAAIVLIRHVSWWTVCVCDGAGGCEGEEASFEVDV